MDCYVNTMVFLRANGSLVCGCDVGGLVELQHYDPSADYFEDVLSGIKLGSIRKNLCENKLPFPELCDRCWLLTPHVDFDRSFITNKTINYFQIEPTILCNLHCPSCIPPEKRKGYLPDHGYGNVFLRKAIVKKILADLQRHGVIIKNIELIGHGEPLIGTDTWDIVRICRELFPRAYISMTTNANSVFNLSHVTSGLNQMQFAVDGTSQETYGKYRQGGDFQKAYQYMKDFSLACEEQKIPVYRIWKYVIFDHNDTLKELGEVQKMAIDIKIPAVHYVFTMWGPRSCRLLSPEEIPRISDKLQVTHGYFKFTPDHLEKMVTVFRDQISNSDYQNANNALRYFVNALNREFSNEKIEPDRDIGNLLRQTSALINTYSDKIDSQTRQSFEKFILDKKISILQ